MKRNWQMQGGLPTLKDNPLSVKTIENEFGTTLDEWEDRIFSEATHFRLHRFPSQSLPNVSGAYDRSEVTDFEDALRLAGGVLSVPNQRVLIYAVAESGRFVCLEKKKWAHFLELWSQKC